MIVITVRFQVRPEFIDGWPERVRAFTEAVRAEPGNLWFDWSRSLADPNEFVLLDAFVDGAAGAAHVAHPHFQEGLDAIRPALARTPRIINTEVPGTEWSEMGELEV
ncbi:MAG: putative quinol monooxygenase [Propionibacteriaceae bacterium]